MIKLYLKEDPTFRTYIHFYTGLHSYLPITSSPSLENRYALVLGNATQSG